MFSNPENFEIWKKANPIISERLIKLYNTGRCRYCSW